MNLERNHIPIHLSPTEDRKVVAKSVRYWHPKGPFVPSGLCCRDTVERVPVGCSQKSGQKESSFGQSGFQRNSVMYFGSWTGGLFDW